MSCPVCSEFGYIECSCCEPRHEYETIDCPVCDGIGFFPYKDDEGLTVKEYNSLHYSERMNVEREHCEECNGTGEIIIEI